MYPTILACIGSMTMAWSAQAAPQPVPAADNAATVQRASSSGQAHGRNEAGGPSVYVCRDRQGRLFTNAQPMAGCAAGRWTAGAPQVAPTAPAAPSKGQPRKPPTKPLNPASPSTAR